MKRDPLSVSRALSIGLLLLGALALALSLFLRRAAEDFRVDSVHLKPGLEGLEPVLHCRVKGSNPLPMALDLRHLDLEVGAEVLPAGFKLGTSLSETLQPGPFTLETTFKPGARSVSVIAGQGFSILFGKPLDYSGTLRLGVGPFERSLSLDGTLSTTL